MLQSSSVMRYEFTFGSKRNLHVKGLKVEHKRSAKWIYLVPAVSAAAVIYRVYVCAFTHPARLVTCALAGLLVSAAIVWYTRSIRMHMGETLDWIVVAPFMAGVAAQFFLWRMF